jgi:hypothetical protein
MSDLDDHRAALARRILEMIDKHHGDVDKALSTLITDIDEEVLRLRSDVLEAVLDDVCDARRWPALSEEELALALAAKHFVDKAE